ncbi:MAG: hypothetical protein AB8B60_10820 [Sulfitobacter sp.]
MRWALAGLVLAMIAGCGADGEPVQPTRDATLTLSDTGLSGMARVGVRQGPLNVSVGLGL